MNEIPLISTPISEPWTAWILLALLLCFILAIGHTPGAVKEAVRDIFSKLERNYNESGQDTFSLMLFQIFRVGVVAMMVYLFLLPRGRILPTHLRQNSRRCRRDGNHPIGTLHHDSLRLPVPTDPADFPTALSQHMATDEHTALCAMPIHGELYDRHLMDRYHHRRNSRLCNHPRVEDD